MEFIRKEGGKYHDYCYDNYKLFEEGSWLHRPVKNLIDQLHCLKEKTILVFLI